MKTQITHIHWQLSPDISSNTAITGEEDIHQCISNILATRKGSDILRPEFGSHHFDYIDQPFDVAVPNIVREIWTALERWETRIVVQSVDVTGEAPHFYFDIRWCLRDDVERQIYQTEVKHG